MSNIAVSVIITTHNRSDSLRAAVASVEQCQNKVYEIIIVNDGSTDLACLGVLAELEQRGYRVIHQPNQGVSQARNTGIALARGEYILLLDDDNLIRSEYITKGIKILGDNPTVGVVYADFERFGEKTGRCSVGEFDLPKLLTDNFVDNCAIYRRVIWEQASGYDTKLKIWEDYDFWLSAAEKDWQFHYIPEILFDCRVHDPSKSSQERDYDLLYETAWYISQKHAALYAKYFPSVNALNIQAKRYYYHQWQDLKVKLDAQEINQTELVQLCQNIAQLQAALTSVESKLLANVPTVKIQTQSPIHLSGRFITDRFFSWLKRFVPSQLLQTIHDRKLASEIARSELFDAKWYCETYPDVAQSGILPALHYVHFGGFEGRNPSAYFNSSDYLAANPDVVEIAMNPLLHWLRYGRFENRPLEVKAITNREASIDDNAVVKQIIPDMPTLFDVNWYRQQYVISLNDADEVWRDYFTVGWLAGRNPNPFFNVPWYLAQMQEDGLAFEEPLNHYLLHGRRLGYLPHPFFDINFYSATYPDVVQSGFEPLTHYIQYGIAEQRSPNIYVCNSYRKRLTDLKKHGFSGLMSINRAEYSFTNTIQPALESVDFGEHIRAKLEQLHQATSTKDTLIVVTHEMSRTGAPIILWNMMKSFKQDFDIIVFALKGGDIASAFEQESDFVVTIDPWLVDQPAHLSVLLQKLTQIRPVRFAIVNSIEATDVLEAFWRCRIPSIHLIHEFATNIRFKERFEISALFSSHQVYPAQYVLDDALRYYPKINRDYVSVLPQGFCESPNTITTDIGQAKERDRVRRAMRPIDFPSHGVVILGMGSVIFRKGVDLFMACAKQVRDLNPKIPFRFVWIGDGYDPINDTEYSTYLSEQRRQLNLDDIVEFVEPISQVDIAYQIADIFLLSSRLDPLPLVAQDALKHALPLVCFKNTNGMVEYLEKMPAADGGVVPYLDIAAAAQRISNFINDAQLRVKVGKAGQHVAQQFSFAHYVAQLRRLAEIEIKQMAQEQADCRLIAQSGEFDYDFFCQSLDLRYRDLPIRYFVRTCLKGSSKRKGLSGFHPSSYATQHQLGKQNALAHYLASGKPSGPWQLPVIEGDPATPKIAETSLASNQRVALHLHLDFVDIAYEIIRRLAQATNKIDLLISVPSEAVALQVKDMTTHFHQGVVEIRVVPNRGRDTGPLLTEFGAHIVANYDIVGHLYTKKSLDWGNRTAVNVWRHFLQENLLGGQVPMADHILSHFVDSDLGLVFPDDPNIVWLDDNRAVVEDWATKLGVRDLLPSTDFNFPVGGMFWARTAALKPLFDLGLNWDDYPDESMQASGNMLDALEMLIPFIAQKSGYTIAVTHVKGVSR